MSGYVFFNGPVCLGMMQSRSVPAILFWNILNQSQNALVNYFGSNSGGSSGQLLRSYLAAVAAAVAVSLGLSSAVKARFTPALAATILKFCALPTSCVASCTNCYIMRRPEIPAGITLLDADSRPVLAADGSAPRSSVAARKAVLQTVASRLLLQVPGRNAAKPQSLRESGPDKSKRSLTPFPAPFSLRASVR